jgi:sugar (pentulose or hexulose) kinase
MYLAIDIGTTSAKAALYQEDGSLFMVKNAAYPIQYPALGWAEENPLDWWAAVKQLCAEILPAAGNPSIACICVTGQAPSCVPIDREGKPLRPAILWLDRRSQPQVDWLIEHVGLGAAERISANTIDSYYGGVKWLWFARNEPELYRRTWKISQASGYITFLLTGELATDPSHAGMCSPCYNLHKRAWDESICEAMQIDFGKLPALSPSASVIGQVTATAAGATGLKAGTPVVCGGGDFAAACLGAGVRDKGSAAMMLGTSGNLLVPDMQNLDPRLINTVHLSGEGLTLGAVYAGGSVQWFGDMLGIKQKDLFSMLDQEAALTPAGAEGLVFLPYLMGERTPIWDSQARGVFLGLANSHSRGHLFRAVLEGVAFGYRQMLEILIERGNPLTEIIAINGGARSPLWRQIFAEVLGVPIRWRPNSGGTMLGGAYLAAVGSGIQKDFSGLTAWLEPTLDSFPNPAHAEVYQRQFSVFSQLYGRLKDCFVTLSPVL